MSSKKSRTGALILAGGVLLGLAYLWTQNEPELEVAVGPHEKIRTSHMNAEAQRPAVNRLAESASNPALPPWTGWRGPKCNGETEGVFPTEWSAAAGQDGETNIAWTSPEIPRGHSTPVFDGKRIWVTYGLSGGKTGCVAALDFATGQLVFDGVVYKTLAPDHLDVHNYPATPSPVLSEDGKLLFVHFGQCCACIETDNGKIRWKHEGIRVTYETGPASSPALGKAEGRLFLIIPYDGNDANFVLGFDALTGAQVWKSDRNAPGLQKLTPSLRRAFSTPLATSTEGAGSFVSACGQWAQAMEISTGKKLWEASLPGSNTSAPFLLNPDGSVIYVSTQNSPSLTAFDTKSGKSLWQVKGAAPEASGPVFAGGKLFWTKGTFLMSADPDSGRTGKKIRLEHSVWGSPLVVRNGDETYFYLFDEAGNTLIYSVENGAAKQIGTGTLPQGGFSSPIAAGDSLILRGGSHVYRIRSMAKNESASTENPAEDAGGQNASKP